MIHSRGEWTPGEGSPGDVIDERFRLERVVGEGGMGVVWAATRLEDGEPVALKILRGVLHGRPDARRRMLREVRAAMAVRHPNVLDVSDLLEISVPEPGDFDRTLPVIVMPLLSGVTLAERLERRGALPITEVAGLFLPVVSAVGSAHARGVVHRDLKPENIFIVRSGAGESPSVLDFGVAKLRGSNWLASTTLTRPGMRIGTPRYMAPEQAVPGQAVDHRADVWALGVLLYECLSGIRPIEGDTHEALLDALFDGVITPLGAVTANLPDGLTSAVDRMLSRRVERRPDLAQISRELEGHTEVRSLHFEAPDALAESPTRIEDEEDEEAPVAQRRGKCT